MEDNNLKYTLKIWLTALLFAPLIVAIIEKEIPNEIGGFFVLAIACIIFGGLFSLPSFAMLLILVSITEQYARWNIYVSKTLWSIASLALSVLPFYFSR